MQEGLQERTLNKSNSWEGESVPSLLNFSYLWSLAKNGLVIQVIHQNQVSSDRWLSSRDLKKPS